MPDDPDAGQNPPYGASISYYMKAAGSGPVTITIADAGGKTIRTLRGPSAAGVNRIAWDLRSEATAEVKLRTAPLYAPDVPLGPQGWRSGGAQVSLLELPGTYTVKLSARGRELTQPLVVKKDPHSDGTETELQQQRTALEQLRADAEAAAAMINQMESARAQVQSLVRMLEDREPDVRKEAAALEQKLIAIEGNLIELRATGRGQDGVRWGAKLLGKIAYLANGLASGDNRPTNQQLEVQKILEDRISEYRGLLDAAVKDGASFNDLLKRKNLPVIVWQK
jgi:hypothetical protein